MQSNCSVICPKAAFCNLYKDKILQGSPGENVYKFIYCTTYRFKDCRRYQIYRLAGTCPDFIMPNSKHSTDYILKKIEEELLPELRHPRKIHE